MRWNIYLGNMISALIRQLNALQILTQQDKPMVASAKVLVLQGDISEAEFERVKAYCINPVDSREASLMKPKTLEISTIPTP